LVFALLPYQIATTILVWVLLVGWLYPGVATRMGLIPAGASPMWYGPIVLGVLAWNHTAICSGLVLAREGIPLSGNVVIEVSSRGMELKRVF
jgi:hypothetical protein